MLKAPIDRRMTLEAGYKENGATRGDVESPKWLLTKKEKLLTFILPYRPSTVNTLPPSTEGDLRMFFYAYVKTTG